MVKPIINPRYNNRFALSVHFYGDNTTETEKITEENWCLRTALVLDHGIGLPSPNP